MEMVNVRTCDLIGAALDWAVAMIVDGSCAIRCAGPFTRWRFATLEASVWPYGHHLGDIERYQPSCVWNHVGPLISLYHVLFDEAEDGQLLASCTIVPCPSHQLDRDGEGTGPDHLIAACRAIVSAHLGDFVDVPAELVGGGV